MIVDVVQRLLVRELETLAEEVRSFAVEADLWSTVPGVNNSAGNLVLHGCGNLRHFIGAQLGGTGYVRERDAEFTRTGVPREELLAELVRTREDVTAALSGLADGKLGERYPLEVGGVTLTVGAFLLHLATHLAYHAGQVNYHRRFVTGVAGDVRPLGMAPLRR